MNYGLEVNIKVIIRTMNNQGKHAYLIIAHNNPNQLKLLLKCIDYQLNDIYIHIDKKSSSIFNKDNLTKEIKYSRIYFVKNINVHWAGYSQLNVKLLLMKEALKNGPYDFYHNISGVDLPLYNQTTTHDFFNNNTDTEFISIGNKDSWYLDRVKCYWPINETIGKRSALGYNLANIITSIQIALHINRIKNKNIEFYIGEAWFSITEKFVKYIISQEKFCIKYFKYGDCVDELFIPTLYMMWKDKNKRYISPYNHEIFDKQRLDIVRAIDWHRGKPYTYTVDDYELLMNSHCLFARKFDEMVDSDIIYKICSNVVNK